MMTWKEENNRLLNTYEFVDFKAAFEFMTRVAAIAEEHNHHPTWTNTFNKVSFSLCTHDAGNKVTKKDWRLADAITILFNKL